MYAHGNGRPMRHTWNWTECMCKHAESTYLCVYTRIKTMCMHQHTEAKYLCVFTRNQYWMYTSVYGNKYLCVFHAESIQNVCVSISMRILMHHTRNENVCVNIPKQKTCVSAHRSNIRASARGNGMFVCWHTETEYSCVSTRKRNTCA